MRDDQMCGLNDWARNLVLATKTVSEIGVRKHAAGKIEAFEREVAVPVAKITNIGEIESAFAPGVKAFDLSRYELPDGRVFEEFIQAQPWHSGPCYYSALKDKAGIPVSESI